VPDNCYTFGPFQIYSDRRVLLASGVPVKLGPRPYGILLALAEHGGELVSKEQLIGRVWPDVIVEEGALRVHLTAIRKVLRAGGLAGAPISNVAGRGYTLSIPVARLPG